MTSVTAWAITAAGMVGFAAAAAGGYLLGYRAAASRPERLLRRVQRDSGLALAEAAASIALASRFCEAAAGVSKLASRPFDSVVEAQRRLGEAVDRLLARRSAANRTVEVAWQTAPLDPATRLPDASAFEANFGRLVPAGDAPHGGLLVVSIDAPDRLLKRIGDAAMAELRGTIARVVCRAGREHDLACAVETDVFALLLADADSDDALAHAAAVRDAFRGHPFRLGADGPEILVTASYGFTPVLPGDEPRLGLDRAKAAMLRARRWGRNRLYAYDAAASRFTLVPDGQRPARLQAAV